MSVEAGKPSTLIGVKPGPLMYTTMRTTTQTCGCADRNDGASHESKTEPLTRGAVVALRLRVSRRRLLCHVVI
jgi:hypothetical protein